MKNLDRGIICNRSEGKHYLKKQLYVIVSRSKRVQITHLKHCHLRSYVSSKVFLLTRLDLEAERVANEADIVDFEFKLLVTEFRVDGEQVAQDFAWELW